MSTPGISYPDPTKTIDERLTRIEVHLGLRPAPPPPPAPSHAICALRGLKLPARFFGVPTTDPQPVSQFYNAYKSAHPDQRSRMAIPWTITQETYDRYAERFFPDTEPLSTKRVQEFLVFAGTKRLGRRPMQQFTNRTHTTGL